MSQPRKRQQPAPQRHHREGKREEHAHRNGQPRQRRPPDAATTPGAVAQPAGRRRHRGIALVEARAEQHQARDRGRQSRRPDRCLAPVKLARQGIYGHHHKARQRRQEPRREPRARKIRLRHRAEQTAAPRRVPQPQAHAERVLAPAYEPPCPVLIAREHLIHAPEKRQRPRRVRDHQGVGLVPHPARVVPQHGPQPLDAACGLVIAVRPRQRHRHDRFLVPSGRLLRHHHLAEERQHGQQADHDRLFGAPGHRQPAPGHDHEPDHKPIEQQRIHRAAPRGVLQPRPRPVVHAQREARPEHHRDCRHSQARRPCDQPDRAATATPAHVARPQLSKSVRVIATTEVLRGRRTRPAAPSAPPRIGQEYSICPAGSQSDTARSAERAASPPLPGRRVTAHPTRGAHGRISNHTLALRLTSVPLSRHRPPSCPPPPHLGHRAASTITSPDACVYIPISYSLSPRFSPSFAAERPFACPGDLPCVRQHRSDRVEPTTPP